MKLNRIISMVIASGMVALSCSEDGNQNPPGVDGDTDGDTDTDADGDADTDTDTDSDADADSDADGDSPLHPDDICEDGHCSYIWIANSGESTLSKVNTFTAKEVARYRTCPGDGPFDCDPSRTSVNLHGDVVVTNRYPTSDGTATINPDTVERSSVTKFAADRADCVDRNDDGFITTSTGGDDVLAFGEDECMLWNQDLGLINGIAPRARATAWDGSEDPDTGEGGVVVIGTCLAGQDPDDASNPDDVEWSIENNQLIMMSGDTGDILNTIAIPSTECFYGGAMDPEGNFWVMDGFGFPSNVVSGGLIRVNLASETVTRFENHCGYGISVDADGNVWTSGKHWESNATPNETSCVQKFSATTELPEETPTYLGQFLRGIAVGSGKSAGYVWSAETRGALYKVNQANLADVEVIPTPVSETTVACQSDDNCENGLVGVAIDYEGYVWMVSTTENTAYKYDPESGDFTAVVIGDQPYTYSDMTGMQLRGVVIIE